MLQKLKKKGDKMKKEFRESGEPPIKKDFETHSKLSSVVSKCRIPTRIVKIASQYITRSTSICLRKSLGNCPRSC